jgi:heme exporter protein A
MSRDDRSRDAGRSAARPLAGDPREPEIRVEGLGRSFGRREVLHDVSFTVRRGGFLTLFGPNGAGKTTTLRLLATLLRPSSGSITIAGHDLADDPQPVRRALGFISHNPLLYRDLSAQENLRFYADMYGVADANRRIGDLLERVELSHRRYDVVRTFSKGMLQRLAIARALLHRPRVLLLDEPHSGLDPHAVDILDGLLAEIRAEHTFVMTTHNLGKGLELADQVLILDDGRAVFQQAGRPAAADFAAVYREHVREGALD